MRSFIPLVLFAVAAIGCGGDEKNARISRGENDDTHSQPTPQPASAQELVGKWRLVTVGGQLPASLNIKSHQIDIAADGTWVSDIEMQGQFAGMTMKGGGIWSLADGVVSYTSGANTGKSRARLLSGRLILEPDFSIRKNGAEEVAGEYAR